LDFETGIKKGRTDDRSALVNIVSDTDYGVVKSSRLRRITWSLTVISVILVGIGLVVLAVRERF
jgi:hypothetical protein